MPNSRTDIYAGSCNPSRRAKRLRSGSDSTVPAETTHMSTSSTLPILPKRSSPAKPDADIIRINTPANTTQEAVPTPAKRGRKPGSGSRATKEAQRKLNHSIIEKVRRTKINDALATLRRLVPDDYSPPQSRPTRGDEDGRDDEHEVSKQTNAAGKKEKEKEFKLEILVRTVSFLQELLDRVSVLEGAKHQCTNCGGTVPSPSAQGGKRKRDQQDAGFGVDDETLDARTDHEVYNADGLTDSNSKYSAKPLRPYLEHRLPSISSWLPDPPIDPSLFSPSQTLPSPPSSTNFNPVRTSRFPPTLTLSPVATCNAPPPRRTPEDESAASLLLQISTSSPTFLPSASSSPCTGLELSESSASEPKPSPSRGSEPSRLMQAQTPGSLLGMKQTQVS